MKTAARGKNLVVHMRIMFIKELTSTFQLEIHVCHQKVEGSSDFKEKSFSVLERKGYRMEISPNFRFDSVHRVETYMHVHVHH